MTETSNSNAMEDDDESPDLESVLLEQLHQLHRQLAEVREFGAKEEDDTTLGKMVPESNNIIICSLRRCVRVEKKHDDDSWQYISSNSGLKNAIDYLSISNKVKCISSPGCVVDQSSQEGVRRKMEAEYNCTPVFLSSEIIDLYHHKFCNVILWPLFHSIPQRSDARLLENFTEQYDAYCAANQKFLDIVSEVYKEGDIVLVCGYELMNLPSILRRRFPDVVCGFFLHCPFPSSEFFRMLPVRDSLLKGILGADLVVFNHFDYVRHFLNACTRMLGLESSPSRIEYNGRVVSLGICPMGINPNKYVITSDVESHINALRKDHAGMKIIVTVHKLDFCKGIPESLEAFDFLLSKYPNYRHKVVLFVLLRDSGRTSVHQYKLLSRRINELVGSINGRFGSAEYCPIRYLRSTIDDSQLVALYNIAEVAIVNSIKEGINLQAMEYVASQSENSQGVLVYSEFAGCASSFKGALLVNPMHIEQVASSIDTALRMSKTTKQIRFHQLSRYVQTYTSSLWAQRIMSTLNRARMTAREYNVLDKLDKSQLLSYYERSRRRLFLLDYDGTLMPYQSMPQLAQPSPAVLNCIEQLTADRHNVVYIISGRDKGRLQEWFGHLPHVGLAAEHGYWFRPPVKVTKEKEEQILVNEDNSAAAISVEELTEKEIHEKQMLTSQSSTAAKNSQPNSNPKTISSPRSSLMANLLASKNLSNIDVPNDVPVVVNEEESSYVSVSSCKWECVANGVKLDWRDEVESILEHFTERTPGSLLETKDSCYTWHFQDADPHFGLNQAKDMQLHFDQMLGQRPVSVVMAPIKKYVYIRPSRLNKGRAVNRILNNEHVYNPTKDFDFILAIGDERTDEDMFSVVKGSNSFTCTVGRKISRAQYYVDDPAEVLQTLTACNSLSLSSNID